MEAEAREAMKIVTHMDIFINKPGPSPNVPSPVPVPRSQSPPQIISPTVPNPPPPALMSVNPFPDLPKSDVSSPPRKWRRTEPRRQVNDNLSIFRNNDNWQRFFVIAKKEGDFSKMSPFLYCGNIINAIGKPKSVQRMASGSLSIEATSIAQGKLLMELKMLGNDEVLVEPNKKLNTSKGVVVCRDFMVCSEEEIKIGMADQGVIDVRRINRRQGGTLVATASLILTFDRPTPPEQIEAAYYKLKVRRYIPSPMRCFKCLKFGHTSLRCRSAEQVCVCGLFVHVNAPCQDPPICINCADQHSSRSPECLIFKEEKEIQRIKTLQNVPYNEAREIVKNTSYVKPNLSYAAAAKKDIERKDWQKFLQPFMFHGNQGPSKPVWMAPERKTERPPSPQEARTQPPEVGVDHPSTSQNQGTSLAPLSISLPTPLPTPLSVASAGGRQVPALPFPVRPALSRQPPRSPPRKARPARPSRTIKSITESVSERPVEGMVGAAETKKASATQTSQAAAINWLSSREDNDTDPDTGDSNKTVLTDAGQIPIERPVVRRKRKGRPRTPKK